VRLNIKEILDKKGITRYELAKRLDVTYKTVDKMYAGDSTSIKLETLEAMCKILKCTPNDIIVSEDPEISRLLLYVDKIQRDEQKDKEKDGSE